MKLAFVDLMFSWPPLGGAPADVYHVLLGLQREGHDVHLFHGASVEHYDRGNQDIPDLGVPTTRIELEPGAYVPRILPERFLMAVDRWKPDVVFVGFGFFMKPYLIEALRHYPLVGRYYAYEVACPRDFRLFKEGRTCPNNYLRTPDACRRCTVEHLRREIVSGRPGSYVQEYLDARAYAPGYYRTLVTSLGHLDAILVSNGLMRNQLGGVSDRVHVVPGGVDLQAFTYEPPPEREPGARQVILMPGRTDDPSKGLDVLIRAGERLARRRSDFMILVTGNDYRLNRPWLTCVGWRDHREMMTLYRDADVCVVPSVWEEPFGLVAVEAMASGRPVCASRVGGLQDIVLDGETGFLSAPHDADVLAEKLGVLLDDAALRHAMGAAARKRVETHFAWDKVIRTHYLPILEGLAR